jgi:hypothetical protein
MLKAVAASGRIDVGKRWAGRVFEVVQHGDGRIELLPADEAATRGHEGVHGGVHEAQGLEHPGGIGPSAQADASDEAWAVANRDALEAYARRVDRHGTAAEQLQTYLASSSGERDGHT